MQYTSSSFQRQNSSILTQRIKYFEERKLRDQPTFIDPGMTRYGQSSNRSGQGVGCMLHRSLTPRRLKIIDKLRKEGINVKTAFNCYSSERDEILSKARLHSTYIYDDSKSAEIWRLGYCISNRVSIVAKPAYLMQVKKIDSRLIQYEYKDLVSGVKKN